jgi:hypothetical protein
MKTRRLSVCLAVVITGCAAPLVGEPEQPTEESDEAITAGTVYKLTLPKMSGDTGNCVDVAGASLNNGANIQEWDCNGGVAQQFVAEAGPSPYFRFKNTNSGKCLNIYAGAIDAAHPVSGNANGANIQQWTCGTGDNNYWALVSYNGGYQFKSKLATGDGVRRCMDVTGGATHTANGTNIELWSCGSTTSLKGNQTFNPVAVSGGGGGGTGCSKSGLTWKTANKTWYTSYPAPGSEECIKYSGCLYEGQFSACSGTKSLTWVQSHNIASFFPNFTSMKLHDLCIKSGTHQLVVTVYDTCADSDCSGCCTENKGTADALIDLESYTNARFGVSDGMISWADLGPTTGSGCN